MSCAGRGDAVSRAPGRVRRGGGPRRIPHFARASPTRLSATSLARVKGDRYLRRAESNPDESALDKLTRETISRWVTPRWKKHLETLVDGEKPDAVVVFTIPMAHLRGIPDALRERFGIPICFYDGDVPMSLPEYGGMDTGFNPYHGADPWEYDLVLSNSEGGIWRAARAGSTPRRGALLGRRPGVSLPRRSRRRSTSSSTGTGTSSGATG